MPNSQHLPADNPYPNHLIREILEQPATVTTCVRQHLDAANQLFSFPELSGLPIPQTIRFVSCGTSAHAAMWASSLFADWARIPSFVDVASESIYQPSIFLPHELVIAVSQSGESVDTIAAVQKAKEAGLPVLSVCNKENSSLTNLSDFSLLTNAGPEIAIPATKSMTAQMLCLLMLAAFWAKEKGTLPENVATSIFEELPELAENMATTLPVLQRTARALSTKYRKFHHFLFTGRGLNYPLALEGALKFKEITYIHAEGSSLGAIPHGARALLDATVPVFALATSDPYFEKTLQNLRDLKAEGSKIIALANPGKMPVVEDAWLIPDMYGPLSAFIILPAMQLFAYETGITLNRNVDTPRTLLKAVV